MATRHTDRISLNAASDLTAKQHLFAKISGDNGTDACGAGGDAVGVYLGKAAAGSPIEIGVGPRVPIVLGAALVAGAEIMSDASSRAIPWTTGNRSLGYLIVGGQVGDTVDLLFTQGGRKA